MEEGANFMAKEESTTPKHKEKKTMQAIPFFEALKVQSITTCSLSYLNMK
jgi:hypothetical protein